MLIDWDLYHSPPQLARALWDVGHMEEVRQLSVEQFGSLFDRVYTEAVDIETLWQLGGATNDYLRSHPHSLTVPTDLPRRLLAANRLDARIIGLKLLNRCRVPIDELMREIVRALDRKDGEESCGGVCELLNLLEGRSISSASQLDRSMIEHLIQAVQPIESDGRETHMGATLVLSKLQDLHEKQ